MDWSRAAFEGDKARYEQELAALLAEGFTEGDFRVRQARRRLAVVDRVLVDPAFSGLIKEATDGPANNHPDC